MVHYSILIYLKKVKNNQIAIQAYHYFELLTS